MCRPPDREDEDRAEQDVGDRIGEVKHPGRTVRLPNRTQPEAPRCRSKRQGHDDPVEPNPPAGRCPSRSAPECSDAADRKRNRGEKSNVGQRRIWCGDVEADLVDGPHDLARGPQPCRDAHQRPAEPFPVAVPARCPGARRRRKSCGHSLTDVVQGGHRAVAEVHVAEYEGIGDGDDQHRRPDDREGSPPFVRRQPGAHLTSEVNQLAWRIHPFNRTGLSSPGHGFPGPRETVLTPKMTFDD